MRAHVETKVAINTPIEVSVQRGLDLQQEQLTQQQRMQLEQTQEPQRQGPVIG
ncbi:hypothetical protein KOJCDNHJ_01747 [Xanthomonas citri pv. punicae]|nr:hypothetical protein FICKIIDM_02921 [Xanthomonas citri pv. punicae]UIS28352.1 hypothetical protein KOJCDNHJ_01747 [Xanthomonas citri pv. punicae]CCF66823.1 hypothetical protein XAPC_513 [Xanthomonas citri pv. punicae str. LMG 859]